MKSSQPTLSVAASLLAFGFLGGLPNPARAQSRQATASHDGTTSGGAQASRAALGAGLTRAAIALEAARRDLADLRMDFDLERSASMTHKALTDVHVAMRDIHEASLRETAQAGSGGAARTGASGGGEAASGTRQSGASSANSAQANAAPAGAAAGASGKPAPTQVASNNTEAPSSVTATSAPSATGATGQKPAQTNAPVGTETGAKTGGQAGAKTGAQAGVAAAISPETADNFIGKDVVNQDGQTLGQLKRVITGPNGNIQSAVLEYGGFLGLFTTQAEVDWKRASPKIDNGKLVFDLTSQQVDNAPRYAAK